MVQYQWNNFYLDHSGNAYPETSVVRFVGRRFFKYPRLERKEIRVLDLGCGSGSNTLFLCEERFDVYGVDFSENAIQQNRDRLARRGLNAQLFVQDFRSLPFEADYFHGIIDGAAIQHNSEEEIKKILNEVYRVLKPAGNFFSMLIADHHLMNDSRFETHYFEKVEIEYLFQNFSNVTVDLLEYTEESGTRSIKFWLVEAEK